MRFSFRTFLSVFLPLAVLLIGGAGVYGIQAIEQELISLRNQEAANVRLGGAALAGRIESLTRDLLFLSRHSAQRDAVSQPTPGHLAHLAEDFGTFMAAKGIYDQIRWLDDSGMERVRVNNVQGKPVAVPADRLQNKADHYYFIDALRLSPGEVYISPLDLNVEQGRVEVPHKPVIRIATPVADRHGRKRGIVVLNYLGDRLLRAATMASAEIADRYMILNPEGYWLRSANPADEWGFMSRRPELTLAKRAPVAWKLVSGLDRGQAMVDDGLWTWDTVYPLLSSQRAGAGNGTGFGEDHFRRYFWKSVSHYPAAKLNAIKQAIWLKVGGTTLLLLGLAGLAGWWRARDWALLAEAEARYKTVADFTYDWETWVDPDGHFKYCSPSCEEITGRSVSEFTANPGLLIEIAHPDDREKLETHRRQDRKSDEPCELDFRIVRPDGQVRWLAHACQPVFSETGKFLGRRASNRDITERKEMERRMAEMAVLEHDRDITRQVPGVIFQFRLRPDGSSSVPFVSEGARAIYRLDPEEVREDASRMLALVHPDDLENHLASIQASARDLTPWQQEFRLRFPDGTERRLLGQALPQREEDGSTLWNGFTADITESRRLEQSVRESEKLFRMTFENAAIGIAHVAPDGRFLRINQRYCSIVGYTQEEMLSQTFQDITHPADLEVDLGQVRKMLEGAIQTYTMEKRYIHKNGAPVWVNLTVALSRKTSGEPEYFIAAVEDISERKQAEEELKVFFALIPELLCVASADGRFLKINPMWQALLGYAEEEILATSFFDFIHPDDRDATRKEVEKRLEGNATMRFINRCRTKGDSYRWLEWEAAPAVDGKLLFAAAHDITEQKEMAAAMEERLGQLHEMESAMSLGGIGIFQIDADTGRLFYVNDFCCRLHGYMREELLGMSIQELDPELSALPFPVIAKLIRQRGHERFETLHLHKDGRVFPVEMTLYHHPPRDGSPGYFVAFMTDISRRKAAEDRMHRDAEQQTILRQLLESTLMGGSVEDVLARCLEQLLSLSWLSLLPKGGIFLADSEAQRLRLLVSHDLPSEVQTMCADLPYGRCLCGRAAATGELQFADHLDARHEMDYCGIRDHGHYSLPLTTNGRVVGVLVLFLPPGITNAPNKEHFLTAVSTILSGYIARKTEEQSLAEHQIHLEEIIQDRTANLKASEARTRAILTTMLDSVVQIDSRGIIQSVNFAVQEMFGYEESEMVGHNVSMLMPEPYASAHDGYISRYQKTRKPHVIGDWREVTGRRKDGSVFPIELAVNEMVDDSGSSFIGVMRDMTRQKSAEQNVKVALQAAQAATEAKSNFLANMSHEIRTPLNAVLGLAQIGVRDNHGRETAETFRRIRDSGSHLLDVVNDILDFSKIEAGKLKIEKRPFALFSVIDNVRSFVASRAEEKGLKLVVSVDPDLSDWVEGDSLRLAQILTNLLSNAIKFTEHGEVMLRAARDGDNIDFMVADSGIGMSEANLERLFHSFEQADSSTTRHYGGTGLGLAISRNLANLMGGDIAVDSRPGAGSSFYLHLPLPSVPPPAHSGKIESAPAGLGPRLAGISVLAADDVDINRFILEDLLTHEGARVTFAENGQEALAQLSERGVSSFDVVLMDVQMPVMDGLEATRCIAEMAPALPVIGLTAHAMAEERDKCFAAGMVDHVAKPIDMETLVAAILRQVRLETGYEGIPRMKIAVPAQGGAVPEGCNVPEIIDLAVLAGRVGDDPAKIAKYTERFVETANHTLDEMKEALAAKDLATLSSLGHRLKSAALTVGAMRFGKICQELESLRNSNDLDAAHAGVDQLDALFAQITQRVQQLFRR